MYEPEPTTATVNWPRKVPSRFFVHVTAPTGVPVMLGGGAAHVPATLSKPAPRTAIVDVGDPEVGLRTISPTTLKAAAGDGSSAMFPVAITV